MMVCCGVTKQCRCKSMCNSCKLVHVHVPIVLLIPRSDGVVIIERWKDLHTCISKLSVHQFEN